MPRNRNNLFNRKTIQRLCDGVSLDEKQFNAAKEWIQLLEQDKLQDEKKNYLRFAKIILSDCLGYDINGIDFESGNVEFQFSNEEGKNVICYEAKGTSTKDLFAIQHRTKKEHETPIKQTWDYIGNLDLDYGVCTNYRYFILITKRGYSKNYIFDFMDISKENDGHLNIFNKKLKEFVAIFSKNRIIDEGFAKKLYNESQVEERDFTKEFYKLFHETRLMLIKAFKVNGNMTQSPAIYFTQIFLNRMLFLFFALDADLIPDKKLFTNRILAQLQLDQCTEHSRKIYDDINLLFTALDKGDNTLDIFGFNGTLFDGKIPNNVHFLDYQDKDFFAEEILNSKLSKTINLEGLSNKIFKKYEETVSPIIRNLLIMDSFDFNSEVNVTILGHILEQSIGDLDELQKLGNTQRKIDGVYYTPETITEYICTNTIISYLSKNNVNDLDELILEYENNFDELEEKIKNIKIIDPACGSGAFLIKAVEILLEIDERINSFKQKDAAGQIQIDHEIFSKKKISEIINNNIFGVDINRESVEITKLSLFLKMAQPEEKLKNISKNIVTGNSLIDDRDIDILAFDWNSKFPEVMNNGGFDIVIGNPPWQILKPDIDEFFSPLKEILQLLSEENPNETKQFSKLTKPKKNVMVKKCLENSKINTAYQEYNDRYNRQIEYISNSTNFEFQTGTLTGEKSFNRIDINLYKLFIEKSHQILNETGVCGMVVPSGFCSDLGTKELRKLIFERNRVLELCVFVNRKPIFEEVHRQFKFCTLLFQKGNSTGKFLAKFGVEDDIELQNFRKSAFEYDIDLVKFCAPNSFSIIECKDEFDQQMFRKLFKFPILSSNEWNLKGSREFDMTDDSDLFHTGDVGPPLYEGKMINMFTDDFSSPTYWIEEKEGFDRLEATELYRIKRSTKQKDPKITLQIHAHEYRLIWRKITNPTNARTLISTVLRPNVFLGNSIYYIHPIIFDGKNYVRPISYEETIYLCGIFNSFVIDFILRHKVGTNMTVFHIMELPVQRFDKKNPLHQKIFKNSAMLICTTDEYSDLRNKIGISEYVTEASKRMALEAQINAYAAKIYDLKRQELEYILDSFPIVEKNLKDLTLDEFTLISS